MRTTLKKSIAALLAFLFLGLAQSCQQSTEKEGQSSAKKLSIDYESFKLENGLEIILHEDKSDPIVAVAIMFHVGSNREKPGRTGFAHFFEHMLFQRSENIPQGAFFNKISEWGGTFNGGTWQDGTVYYEVVPKDALERVLWMESDRMGFLINAVTKASLEGEKPVVKNEKRQRNDNQPYGHTNYVINQALYPKDHPYNWEVIGLLEDLQNATLDDVKEFYNKYYGPNNATMVIAGDFNKEEVKQWAEKYFAEIPAKPEVEPIKARPAKLDETKKFYYEDNFAKVPELRMVYPTVEQFHPDSYPLEVLGELLSEGKRAPLYKVLVEEKKVAPEPRAYNNSQEIAGTFTVRVRAFDGIDTDAAEAAVMEAFDKFEKEGFTDADLQRIKNSLETNFYNGISSVLGKSFQLAQYAVFNGDPGYISKDIQKTLDVTREDVMRVFKKYIKGQPYVGTSFVPKGNPDLALENAEQASVIEEEITADSQQTPIEGEEDIQIAKTPSKIDRTVTPPVGETPVLNPPSIWTSSLSNGMGVYGIEAAELPLVNFSVRIAGGQYLDSKEKAGVANLITDMMMEGTANKTPEELEDAIGQLGANIRMYTSDEYITLSANCLARNYDKVLALVEEILMQPRWDAKEFDRVKQSTLNSIQQRSANPNAVASDVFNKLLYGDDHIFAMPVVGRKETVENITLDDLKAYYNQNFSPSIANFHISGAIGKDKVLASLKNFESKWQKKEVSFPAYQPKTTAKTPAIYFVDIPDAKQSVVRIGKLAPSRSDKMFYPIEVANERLGGGSSGKLFQVLREEKGYTYGAYSYLSGNKNIGQFIATSSVRSNVTLESVETFRELLTSYKDEYSEEDLEIVKNTMIKQNTRRFETLNSLMNILENISTYKLPQDYIKQEENVVTGMTLDRVKELVAQYMNPEEMVFVVVGDAKTQFSRLKDAGIGNPILVDKEGNIIEKGS